VRSRGLVGPALLGFVPNDHRGMNGTDNSGSYRRCHRRALWAHGRADHCILGRMATREGEAAKREWAFEDARSKRLEEVISQLMVKLASAHHSMTWIAWIALEAPNRLTQEQAAVYDKEINIILPEITGLSSNLASLNMEAYSMAKPVIDSLISMDVQIGRACLNIGHDQEEAARALVTLYPKFVDKEQGLPVLMSKIAKLAYSQGPATRPRALRDS
jgi:hypothetical protein